MDFFFDTTAVPSSNSSDSESDCDELPAFSIASVRSTQQLASASAQDNNLLPIKKKQSMTLSSALDPGIDIPETYLSTFPHHNPEEAKNKLKSIYKKIALEELSKKSVLCQPTFEKQSTVSPYLESRRKIRRERLKERDKTAGTGWFNLPATELTEERKNDLMVLQMRKVLDPKHFYKRSTLKTLPKYFQIGTVVEHPADFYHSRIPKKQRKKTIVDELLADSEFRSFQKRKYAEVLSQQPKKVFHTQKKKKKTKSAEARSSDGKKKSRKAKGS